MKSTAISLEFSPEFAVNLCAAFIKYTLFGSPVSASWWAILASSLSFCFICEISVNIKMKFEVSEKSSFIAIAVNSAGKVPPPLFSP